MMLNTKILMLVTFILAMMGCATMQPPPKYKALDFSMHREVEGLKISIEPFNDSVRVQKYFGIDLISDGIFPVYVRIINGTKDTSYLVGKETFSMNFSGKKTNLNKSNEIKNNDAAKAASIAGTILISPALFLVGGKLYTDATVINYAFNQNRLQTTTISPGKVVNGFVYFSIPEKGIIPKVWQIVASIKNMSGSHNIELIF